MQLAPAPDQNAYYHEPYDYGYDGYDQYGYAEDAYGAPDAYGELGGLAVAVCVFEHGLQRVIQ